ncbi:MAG TPA: gamma-glutamylcyclotransferase family protein [Methyloceanibacter sp.]|nr:gamma-glutamylcyclotransferase family protein [Methyloceanibacter sp.]
MSLSPEQAQATSRRMTVLGGSFLFFAYGSNMLTDRLRERCPDARPLGAAIARGYVLSFSKRSRDGSSKATLLTAADGAKQDAYGVLFEIPLGQRRRLDKAEDHDKGYQREDAFVVVSSTGGKKIAASTYLARSEAHDENLLPYDWYRALIVAGALEHELPESYVAALRDAVVRADPDAKRREKNLLLLQRSGYGWLLEGRA